MRDGISGAAKLDEIDRRSSTPCKAISLWCPSPIARLPRASVLPKESCCGRLDALLERRVLTRFGPMFQIERAGGAFVLAAMKVPEADFERVTTQVNAFPEVAHNYRREHALNMWFVLATATPEGIAETVAAIEAATGLPVFSFPKEREYFVEMKLHA